MDGVTEMLGELGAGSVRDGADPEVLARLDEARRQTWD